MSQNDPGWQPDPTGRFEHRYWDGSQWTDNVANAGVAATDAYTPADAAPAAADEPAAPPAPAEPATPADEPVVPASAGWTDPTTQGPVTPTDPTATWPATPAPPPPPTFPPPAPPGLGGPGGPVDPAAAGSKRGLLIGGGILAAVAAAVAAFLLLGGDDDGDRDRIRGEMAAQIRSDSDLTNAQAECMADAIIDEIGTERLKDVDFSADDPPEGLADDFFKAALASLEKCNVDESLFGEGDSSDTTDESAAEGTYGSDPDLDELYDRCEAGDYQACDDLYNESPTGSEYEEFGDTCGGRNDPSGYCVELYGDTGGDSSLPEDFEQQLADAYESTMGLPKEKAECLAGKIADAVSSGELNEEQAMSEIFSFLEDCDIDMSELTG